MTIYFTSDLHFHHQRIIDFCPKFRPFDDIETMNEHLIQLWNETVRPEDEVYNLGDLSFSKKISEIKQVLRRLNGKHHLIYGNHDHLIEEHIEELKSEYKNDGLPLLSSAQDYLKIKLEKRNFVLFHYPIQEWDSITHGAYHLHGHIHNRMAPLKGRILNVGLDLHGKFLNLADVDFYLKALPIYPFPNKDTENYQKEKDLEALPQLLKQHLKELNH